MNIVDEIEDVLTNKQNSTATPPVHSNVGLNLPEAKSVIAAASRHPFA